MENGQRKCKTIAKHEPIPGHHHRTETIRSTTTKKACGMYHTTINEYLHRFNIIETAECECGAAKETIDHFLLNCELYDEERDKLRRKVGAHGMRTCSLLGDKNIIRHTILRKQGDSSSNIDNYGDI